MNKYPITVPLTIPARANPRFADLTFKESERGGRVIGGDMGDLWFSGYTVEDDHTVLYDPWVATNLDLSGWNYEELYSLASGILYESYASIGVECVEHS